MSLRITLIAVSLLSGLIAVPAWGQQQNNYQAQQQYNNQRQQGTPTFSDRLRSLRDGVLGPPQNNQGQMQGQGNNPNMQPNQGGNGYNGQNQQRRNNGQPQNAQRPNNQQQNNQRQNGQRQNVQMPNGQMQNGQMQNGRMNGGQANNNRVPSPNENRNFTQGNQNAQRSNQPGSAANRGNNQAAGRPNAQTQPGMNNNGNVAAKPQRPGSSRRTAQSKYQPKEVPASAAETEDLDIAEIEAPTASDSDNEPNRLTPADLQDPATSQANSDEVITDPENLVYEPNRKKSSRRKANQPSETETKTEEEPTASVDFTDSAEETAAAQPAEALPRVTSSAKTHEAPLPRVANSRNSSRGGNEFVVTKRGPSIRVETAGPKRIMVNKPGTYKVNLHNSGDVPAEDVLVVVQVPAWAEVLSAEATAGESRDPSDDRQTGEFQWAVAHLGAQSHEELVLQIVAHENRSFDLAVQWNSSPITAQTKVEVQEAKLEASLAGPHEVSFGEKAVYKLTFSNPGSADAENVVVKLLPLGNGDEPVETHSLGKISAGASKTVEVELVARQEGQVKVQVQAVADGGLTASAVEDVVVRRPAIKVAVDAPKFRYSGTVATYTIKVSNTGSDAARDVQIAVQLPRGAQFSSCSSDGKRISNGAGVTWRAESIKAGEEREFQVKCSLATPGVNKVQATATAAGDLSHTITGTTTVEALADLTLDVTDPQGAIGLGEDVIYEIVVRNRGTKAAEDVEVTAAFAQSVEPLSVTGDKHDIRGSTVEFEPIASIAPGQEVTLKIRAQARRAGTHVMRTEVRSKTMQTALVEEETTRFYGDDNGDDDVSQNSSRLEQPAKSTDTRSAKFQPRKTSTPRDKSRRAADPANHESTEWTSSRYEQSPANEPQRLDEPAELQPIE